MVSAGVVTTFASAAAPDNGMSFEGRTGTYTAISGNGTFSLPDVSGTEGVPPPGQAEGLSFYDSGGVSCPVATGIRVHREAYAQ